MKKQSKQIIPDSVKDNKIILFANQKGGVGKTTLCGLFSNYLSVIREVPLLVVDADPQQTYSNRRKDDLRREQKKWVKKWAKGKLGIKKKSLSHCELGT